MAASGQYSPINAPGRPMYQTGTAHPVAGQLAPAAGPVPPQMTSPTKEVNFALLCRVGQETVQEIVQKTTEVFQCLKATQLPNGMNVSIQACQERKTKLDESIRNITQSFKKLRLFFERVEENCLQLEQVSAENLIPYVDESSKEEKPKQSEVVKYIQDEHQEMVEQVKLKNQQLKEVVDHLRKIIWEINVMMATRKT